MSNGKGRFTPDPNMTHQEIADLFGVSRAAVADMEKKALQKLKSELEKRGYTLEDFFGEDGEKE